MGLITSLGLMGIAGIQLEHGSCWCISVLIGLGIDYAIQFHARFDEESRKGSLDDAVLTTVTGPGLLLCTPCWQPPWVSLPCSSHPSR